MARASRIAAYILLISGGLVAGQAASWRAPRDAVSLRAKRSFGAYQKYKTSEFLEHGKADQESSQLPAESKESVEPPTTNAESQLIDHLLSSYNSMARPTLDFNEPVKVNFSLQLVQLLDLDIKNQHMTTALWTTYYWFDAFLKWEPEVWGGVTDIRLPVKKIWIPDLLIYNSISDNFDSNYPSNAVVRHDGRINWIPPAITETTCSVKVLYFPFDTQTCEIQFGPWSNDVTRLNVSLSSAEGDLSMYSESGEWKIIGFPAARDEVDFGLDNPFVFITYKLKLKRHMKYGIVNFILPCLLVCLLAVLVFLLPPDSGEKIGLSITVLLTLVVFLEILGDETPSTPDSEPIPVVAKFFVCTMFMVMASCILAVINLYFHHRDVGLQSAMHPSFRFVFLKLFPAVLRMVPPGMERPPPLCGFWNCAVGVETQKVENVDVEDAVTDIATVEGSSASLLRFRPGLGVSGKSSPVSMGMSDNADAKMVISIGRAILKEVTKITAQIDEKNNDNVLHDEWKFAAMALDKACLYLFTILMIMAATMTIGSSPALYE